MMNPFADRARAADSLLCVGLDSDMEQLAKLPLPPEDDPQVAFNRAIVEATADYVCAYKPNLAFYESRGAAGWRALTETMRLIPPEIPVIADAKRGDIGNTARHYAQALFEDLGASAVTVNPLLGHDSVRPFLEYADRVTFLLCHTSNPGAADFQLHGGATPLYRRIAEKAVEWNTNGNVGLVVGATYPDRLAEIRTLVGPRMPILCPGIGAQAGDVDAMRQAGDGDAGALIVNASRSILFAGSDAAFANAARAEAARLAHLLRPASSSMA